MAKSRGVTWEQVIEMATAFPGVETKSAYGTPGLYVGKQFMSRLREPDVIVLKPVEDDEQRFLMETSPGLLPHRPLPRLSDDPRAAVEGAARAARRTHRPVLAAACHEEAPRRT